MTSDDRTSQGFGTQSQTGGTTGIRSAEFDDGLTVQDTTRSAIGSGTAANVTSTTGGTTSHRELGDNHDGAGRDRTDAVTADETGTLIAADKVIGTAVYDASGQRLGTVDSVMLNKRSGKVAYAVMSFGGFLGIGERYHPLPWDVLTYDEAKGGYNIEHSADDLRRAPTYSRDEVSSFGSANRTREVDDYYGVAVGHGDAPSPSTRYGAVGTSVESADVIGSTTGAGSTGMASTGLGSNRNF